MKLTERFYYPLEDAAKLLSCSSEDLVHHAAMGGIEICSNIYIDRNHSELGFILGDSSHAYELIKSKSELISKENNAFSLLMPLLEITYTDIAAGENLPSEMAKLTPCTIDGFMALSLDSLDAYETQGFTGGVSANMFSIPRHVGFDCDVSVFSYGNIEIKDTNLFIDGIEMVRIAKEFNGSQSKPKSKPNENKQNQLIKALLEILYGKGASDNIGSLLNEERGTGELLKDFQLLGIKPPVTRKALKSWVEGVDLDYVEIPKGHSENSKT